MTKPIDSADVVIIGGGIIGASAAYHLTKAGITDILVLERNEMASGATARSAGCFTHSRSDISTIHMIQRTTAAIQDLQEALGESLAFHHHGSVRAVFSPEREQEMRAMEVTMRAAGLQVQELGATDAKALVPWLELEAAARILFVPEDGYADGAMLTSGYSRVARAAGARVRRGVSVSNIVSENGQIRGVTTDQGFVEASWVVCAAGVWGAGVTASIGFGFPGVPTRSHYWMTAPDGSGAPDQPNVQLPDMRAYLRSEVGGMLVGLQEPQSRTYHAYELGTDMGQMNLLDEEYDLDLLFEQASALRPAVPAVDHWGFAHHIAGLSMYTPDGKFVIGKPQGTTGLVVAGGCCGSGLAASGGFGEVISSLISGAPTAIDHSLYDPNRFGVVDPASPAFRDRCAAARSGKSRGNLMLATR